MRRGRAQRPLPPLALLVLAVPVLIALFEGRAAADQVLTPTVPTYVPLTPTIGALLRDQPFPATATLPRPADSTTARLPRTGAGDWLAMARAGLVLVVTGWALLLSTHRRRPRPRHARGRHA